MKEEIEKIVQVLRQGGLILYPTDTVWGIGCDATNAQAVEKIYKLKQTQDKQAMLVLVDSIDNVSRYASKVPSVAWDLMEMSEKPLTLILPKGCGVANNLIPEEGTLGVRVPNHDFCRALLRRFGRPIVSTSANLAGKPTPLTFDEISQDVIKGVDMVVSRLYEKGATRRASTIIMIGEGGQVKVIRE